MGAAGSPPPTHLRLSRGLAAGSAPRRVPPIGAGGAGRPGAERAGGRGERLGPPVGRASLKFLGARGAGDGAAARPASPSGWRGGLWRSPPVAVGAVPTALATWRGKRPLGGSHLRERRRRRRGGGGGAAGREEPRAGRSAAVAAGESGRLGLAAGGSCW